MSVKYKILEKFTIPVRGKTRNPFPEEVDENKMALNEVSSEQSAESFDMIELKISDIFKAVNVVHDQATKKYSPYSWEEEFSDKLDSSPICSLQAMLRHTMKMFKNQEWQEDESGLPHICHLYCRAQMYIVSLIRTMEGSVEVRNPDKNIIIKYPSYINESNITNHETNAYVTPEFIFHIANITNKDIVNVATQYNMLSDKNSVLRRFIIRLYEYIKFHQSMVEPALSAPDYDIDVDKYLKELLIEIIVVCSVLEYWNNATL